MHLLVMIRGSIEGWSAGTSYTNKEYILEDISKIRSNSTYSITVQLRMYRPILLEENNIIYIYREEKRRT